MRLVDVVVNMQISKLVAAGRDLWSKATGDWSAEDYLDKLNWLAESGRERQAEKARKKEQGGGGRESLKEVTVIVIHSSVVAFLGVFRQLVLTFL